MTLVSRAKMNTSNWGFVSSPRHSPRRHSPRSKETARQAEKVVKKRSKGGVKKGSKCVDRPASFWFALCAKYDAGNYKSQCAFLCSKDSGDTVNSRNHQQIFQRKLKAYKEGKLSDSNDQKRNRSGTYLYRTENWLTSIAPTNEESSWLNEEKTLIG